MNVILSLAACTLMMPPTLVASVETIDRGELKAGAPLTQSFEFTNRSLNQTVEITGVKLSCGCAKSHFDKHKLAPGETAKLSIDVNTLAQAAGPWSWKATVRFQCAGRDVEDSLPVVMTGRLVREISLTPPGLAFSLEAGSITQDVFIADSRVKPLAIKGVSSSSSFLTATLLTEKPGQTRLKITLAETAPTGEFAEIISLATNDATYPELRVPVTIVKKKPALVKASPESVQFDGTSTERILLRRPDGKPIQISECSIDDVGMTVSWSKGLDPVAVVAVKSPERQKSTVGETTLRIKLSEPSGEVITVPVRWGGVR